MSGPNSAPNGDATLVQGYSDNTLTCATCKKMFPSKREHLAKHNTLRTGKTK